MNDMDKLIERLQKFKKHCAEFGYGAIEDREFGSILYHYRSNPIDPDYNKHEVAMNGHGIPVCPECGTKIEACGDCADYAEFKAWKVPAPKPEANPRHECVQGGIDEMYSGEAKPATLKPLALGELAYSKNMDITYCHMAQNRRGLILTSLSGGPVQKTFNEETFPACEQLARIWLEEQKEGKV